MIWPMTKLIETEEWKRFAEGVAGERYVSPGPLFRLFRSQAKQDTVDLLALLAGEAGAERDAALQILFILCMNRDVGPR
jgi:hypothetical protein